MKSYDTNSDSDYKSKAAANDRQNEAGLEKKGAKASGQADRLQPADVINSSPYMV